MNKQVKAHIKLDKKLAKIARGIKVLSNLSWTPDVGERFLQNWRSGSCTLPDPFYPKLDFKAARTALNEIAAACDKSLPLGEYIFKTAESFILAAEMLESPGSQIFLSRSQQIYGRPQDPIGFGPMTNLNAAQNFIAATESVKRIGTFATEEYCLLPEFVLEEIRSALARMFTSHQVVAVIDPTLSAKAAAGAKHVRIRGSTCFTRYDVPQLIQHECFVHTLTLLNGREQPSLRSLGLGAPRTLRTQEGLAVLSELITNSIDVSRLRRIALRVKAVAMGLSGADFIEVFRFFLEAGQNDHESYQSAARIFRGGDVRGGIVFTKDIIYLQGLIDVTLFLRKSIELGRIDYPGYLFAGRLTVSDVITLEPYFASGLIAPPVYQPDWVVNRPCLTAFLMYANYLNEINLANISLDQFRDG